MMNLTEKLMELTEKNVVKNSNDKRSVNEMLIDVLLDKKMTRVEVVNELSILRYQDVYKIDELTEEDVEHPEFIERFKKINKTMKNGLDTSISKQENNSSFNWKFKNKYELKKLDNNIITIVQVTEK